MAERELQDFLQEKKKAGAGNIDWQAKKNAWIQAINDFYDELTERYLRASIDDGTVKISYREKQIAEDYIGEYMVRELDLQVGAEKVVLSPKGTNIVGASGRIDLQGDMGDVTIVRQPDGWGVVETRTPKLKVTPLSEESLLTALKSVMRK